MYPVAMKIITVDSLNKKWGSNPFRSPDLGTRADF